MSAARDASRKGGAVPPPRDDKTEGMGAVLCVGVPPLSGGGGGVLFAGTAFGWLARFAIPDCIGPCELLDRVKLADAPVSIDFRLACDEDKCWAGTYDTEQAALVRVRFGARADGKRAPPRVDAVVPGINTPVNVVTEVPRMAFVASDVYRELKQGGRRQVGDGVRD
jgi:hypothetical protein